MSETTQPQRSPLREELLLLLHRLGGTGYDRSRAWAGPPTFDQAVCFGSGKAVEELLARGADPRQGAPVWYAAADGDAVLLERLLDAGCDPDPASVPLSSKRLGHESPLTVAARRGHTGTVRLLLPHVSAERLQPALRAAAAAGEGEAVEMLLAAGADPEAAALQDEDPVIGQMRRQIADLEKWGAKAGDVLELARERLAEVEKAKARSPADLAEEAGHPEVARLLRGEISAVDRPREPAEPFRGAERAAAISTCCELIASAAGEDLQAAFANGQTPLQMAARAGLHEVAAALLAAGVPAASVPAPGTRAAEPGSPLELAALGGHDRVVRLLLEAGVDAPVIDRALHAAARCCDLDSVRCLLAAGADALTTFGERNPFQVASLEGGGPWHEAVVELLREATSSALRERGPGQGVRFERGKLSVKPPEARGAADFMAFTEGQPEWAMLAVKAHIEAVTGAYERLERALTCRRSVATELVPSGERVHFALQLTGYDWTLVVRSLGWAREGDVRAVREDAEALARYLDVPTIAFFAEDTSGAVGAILHDGGSVTGGEGVGKSAVRRAQKLLEQQGVFVPPCCFDDDGLSQRLVLPGLGPRAVERVDALTVA